MPTFKPQWGLLLHVADKALAEMAMDFELVDGDTFIHNHPAAIDMAQWLWLVNHPGSDLRRHWEEQAKCIEAEWGLAIDRPDKTLRSFVERYVLPFVVVPDGYHKAAVLSTVENLSGLKAAGEALDDAIETLRKAKAMVGAVEEGPRGGTVRLGPSAKEFVYMAAKVQDMALKWQEELGEIGLAAKREKKADNEVNVNVNLSSGGLFRGSQAPIDAEFTESLGGAPSG